MILWLKPSASAAILKYVECYWFIEKTADSNSYQFPKLNPDPSTHLIISPPAQAYHYDLNPGVVNGKGSHWLFPHRATFQFDHSQPFVHLGIKFHPGALYALGVGNDSTAILDTVEAMELNDLFKSSLNQKQIFELANSDPEQCCQQLDVMLSPWLAQSKEDSQSQLTQKAQKLLDTTAISALGSKLACSQRTLERSFNEVTGLTLKQCQSMNKLEALENSSKLSDSVETRSRLPGFSSIARKLSERSEQILNTQKKKVEDGISVHNVLDAPVDEKISTD